MKKAEEDLRISLGTAVGYYPRKYNFNKVTYLQNQIVMKLNDYFHIDLFTTSKCGIIIKLIYFDYNKSEYHTIIFEDFYIQSNFEKDFDFFLFQKTLNKRVESILNDYTAIARKYLVKKRKAGELKWRENQKRRLRNLRIH